MRLFPWSPGVSTPLTLSCLASPPAGLSCSDTLPRGSVWIAAPIATTQRSYCLISTAPLSASYTGFALGPSLPPGCTPLSVMAPSSSGWLHPCSCLHGATLQDRHLIDLLSVKALLPALPGVPAPSWARPHPKVGLQDKTPSHLLEGNQSKSASCPAQPGSREDHDPRQGQLPSTTTAAAAAQQQQSTKRRLVWTACLAGSRLCSPALSRSAVCHLWPCLCRDTASCRASSLPGSQRCGCVHGGA